MSKIDENRGYVAMGWDGTQDVPLKIDPVTGRLLVKIAADTGLPNVGSLNRAKIDDNREPTSLAVDSNGKIKPLRVDPSTNYLLVST